MPIGLMDGNFDGGFKVGWMVDLEVGETEDTDEGISDRSLDG